MNSIIIIMIYKYRINLIIKFVNCYNKYQYFIIKTKHCVFNNYYINMFHIYISIYNHINKNCKNWINTYINRW